MTLGEEMMSAPLSVLGLAFRASNALQATRRRGQGRNWALHRPAKRRAGWPHCRRGSHCLVGAYLALLPHTV